MASSHQRVIAPFFMFRLLPFLRNPLLCLFLEDSLTFLLSSVGGFRLSCGAFVTQWKSGEVMIADSIKMTGLLVTVTKKRPLPPNLNSLPSTGRAWWSW